ncbi:hypothetical protein BDY21DRAFT_420714 [Lineolata rhizophorae]|uniref:Uncharacterized protein n=1 Tax=Lineolata rhizophorae TaxID=578093 RepID=A0A6A6P401_9PEZI|nr:hypothetical protein BDY21DRAFT_420714 [Lineolata rhizophorae]
MRLARPPGRPGCWLGRPACFIQYASNACLLACEPPCLGLTYDLPLTPAHPIRFGLDGVTRRDSCVARRLARRRQTPKRDKQGDTDRQSRDSRGAGQAGLRHAKSSPLARRRHHQASLSRRLASEMRVARACRTVEIGPGPRCDEPTGRPGEPPFLDRDWDISATRADGAIWPYGVALSGAQATIVHIGRDCRPGLIGATAAAVDSPFLGELGSKEYG